MTRRRVPLRLAHIWPTFKAGLKGWWDDNVPRLGASLAYYTLFAIAPVLLVAIAIAGRAFGDEAVRGELVGQVQQLIGVEGGRAVQALLAGASNRASGVIATIIGSVTFVLAATGAFLELQTALNTIWRVKPKSSANIRDFLVERLISFGIVVALGFLLTVSLAVSAGLAATSAWLNARMPGMPLVWEALNVIVSLGVMSLMFALLYKVLPDVELEWRDVWVGAIMTAVLFAIGKTLIGLYLGRSSTASAYGAAGSVVVLLLWVYYSAQIVLLGAELTRAYTASHGPKPPPESFATPDPNAVAKNT
ncbi:MAG: YihY/virulence factor BrkB family protein [Gemmatimonadales bacterium]|nr:YihY/virulence factor BrkB family protein [Gemmatimonadales bacterium]